MGERKELRDLFAAKGEDELIDMIINLKVEIIQTVNIKVLKAKTRKKLLMLLDILEIWNLKK